MKGFINRKSEQSEIVICPYCKGKGFEVEAKRINWNEIDYNNKGCYLCQGKRVVNKIVTTEFLVVD